MIDAITAKQRLTFCHKMAKEDFICCIFSMVALGAAFYALFL